MLLNLVCTEPISRKLLQAPKPDFRNYNYYWAVDFNVTLLVRFKPVRGRSRRHL